MRKSPMEVKNHQSKEYNTMLVMNGGENNGDLDR